MLVDRDGLLAEEERDAVLFVERLYEAAEGFAEDLLERQLLGRDDRDLDAARAE